MDILGNVVGDGSNTACDQWREGGRGGAAEMGGSYTVSRTRKVMIGRTTFPR